MKTNTNNYTIKYISKIVIFMLLFTSALNFTACQSKGLEGGFDTDSLELPKYMCAYRSDKREFDIDDVTLTFYYGGNDGIEFPSFELYFENENEDRYLIKEITNHYPKDYDIEDKHTRILFLYHTTLTIKHSESITIPKELFVNDSGYIFFTVTSKHYDSYYPHPFVRHIIARTVIYYKVIGDKVVLSDRKFDK